MKLLLDAGAYVNIAKDTGDIPLHTACLMGNTECVRLMINDSTINKGNIVEETPLHYACGNGNITCVKILLENGADISITDSDGYTPLDWARRKQNNECVEYLCSNT